MKIISYTLKSFRPVTEAIKNVIWLQKMRIHAQIKKSKKFVRKGSRCL